VLIYAADYMVRKMDVKERFFRAVLPMGAAVAMVGVLLLAEPDMGAFMVVAVIAMGILFLGGVNARMFFLIAGVLVVGLRVDDCQFALAARARVCLPRPVQRGSTRWARATSCRTR
jgi:cell division protein FtsW (lipid II flippase)